MRHNAVYSVAEVESLREEVAVLKRRVNGLIELGQEMQRIVSYMSDGEHADLLPDWFVPRLMTLVPLPPDLAPESADAS